MTSTPAYRSAIYRALNGDGSGRLTATQRVLFVVILLSLAFSILATEPVVVAMLDGKAEMIELSIAAVFALEYLVRFWVAGESPRYAGIAGRLRYLVTPLALVDLIAIAPLLFGLIGAESLVLRTVRLVRLVVLAKLARFSRAIRLLLGVIAERRFELGFTALVAVTVVIVASTALYVVEGDIQPETFGSIPRAMWWAVATLTTVGYGDVYPVTALGRVLGAITAFAGVGLIAMPTGILAAALSDALVRSRRRGADEA